MFVTGSMQGGRIQAAQAALLVFLKSLPPGCYFNIVGFGSTFALLFPKYDFLLLSVWLTINFCCLLNTLYCNKLTLLFVAIVAVSNTQKTHWSWLVTIKLHWMLRLVALRYCSHCKKSTAGNQWPHILDRWLFAQVIKLFVFNIESVL